MILTRRFVFGADLVEVAAGTPAVLADHVWMWSDAGHAVAVPVAGRQVHGVVVEADAAEDAALTAVTVTVGGGDRVAAGAVVAAEADPAAPDPLVLDRVIAAARRHALPDDWTTYLAAWGRAGRTIATADGAGGPATLRDLLATPGVDEEVQLRSRFGFMAIHGGDLEAGTDEIARRTAEQAGASYYGVVHPVGFAWHLASTSYDPAESPRLARFLAHVEVVVSIHGYGRRGQWRAVLLGGTNRALAGTVADLLRPRLPDYDLVTDLDRIPVELRGLSPRNPVNAPPRGGVQVELPPRVRGLSPLSPLPGPDGLSSPTRALVDGLAEVAITAYPGRAGRVSSEPAVLNTGRSPIST